MGNLISKSSGEAKGKKRALDSDDIEDSNKRSRQEDTVVIKESDVGITAFVNPALKGFYSILKYR